MGLDINVRKPIKFLGTEEPDNFDDWVYIYYILLYSKEFL